MNSTTKGTRRIWSVWAAATAAVAIGVIAACSGAVSSTTCTNGETRQCIGSGACAGGQVCSGGAWSACDCGGGGDGGADVVTPGDGATPDAGPDITPYLKNCPQVAGTAPMVEIPAQGGGSFCIDTREVTADELATARTQSLNNDWTPECFAAVPPPNQSGTCAAKDRLTGDLPANCVTWCDAEVVCKRSGKRLCTDAEFSSACMVNGVDFPWGESRDAAASRCFGVGPVPASQSTCRPAAPPQYFVKDLAADLFEWTSPSKHRASPIADPMQGGVCTQIAVATYEKSEAPSTSLRCCADKK